MFGFGCWCFNDFNSESLHALKMNPATGLKRQQPKSNMDISENQNDNIIIYILSKEQTSFGLTPARALQVLNPLLPTASYETSLPLATTGLVQRMEPITNLQVAIKNNIDVLYYACIIPMNVFFVEDGQMDKRVFLTTWKDIPAENEVQFTLKNILCNTEAIVMKMSQNNVFTIAKRNVEGQDMLYQSLKLTNGNWVLNELKIQPGNPNITLSLKSQALEVAQGVFQAYDAILHL